MDLDAVYENEDIDGVRFSWNSFPITRLEANEAAIPLGCLYTPLIDREHLPILQQQPVTCVSCKGLMNPFISIDYQRNSWTCPLCNSQNVLPQHLFVNNELPLEIQPSSTTIEYRLPINPHNNVMRPPPVFLYVIDLCQEPEDLEALKTTITSSLALHPPNSLIGIITFDSVINIYELSYSPMVKTFCFSPSTSKLPSKEIATLLNLTDNNIKNWQNSTVLRYLVNLQEHEYEITNVIEGLKFSSWKHEQSNRPVRVTGSALSIATSLLENAFVNCYAKIMLFIGGPCTFGDGTIVDQAKKVPIRSHKDIIKLNVRNYKKTLQFYSNLSSRANNVKNEVNTTGRWSYDIFSGCYDQSGIHEMKTLANTTGGNLIVCDSFTTSIFKQTFFSIFKSDGNGEITIHSNGSLHVKTSSQIKVSGLIGNAESIKDNKGSVGKVSDVPVGKGLTDRWCINNITPRDSFAVFFDMDTVSSSVNRSNSVNDIYIQFQTSYFSSDGEKRIRVTTLKRPTTNIVSMSETFDQECAAVLLTRLAIDKLEKGLDGYKDIIKWLDNLLVKVCHKFGTYTKNNPTSFKLPPNFTLLPQFFYHLKRSSLLQVFNASPDETAFYHHHFLKNSVKDCLTIIQPTLTRYNVESEEPEPVLLDSSSLTKDTVLLLDAFFYIVIYYGEVAAQWRDSNLDKYEYKNVYRMLAMPKLEAVELIEYRFPLPRYVTTDEGKSQARFLLSKLNPSDNDDDAAYYGNGNVVKVLTEDTSLKNFFNRLAKSVVEYTV